MSIQVGPGISINIHVTSDTDGFAKREYVEQKIQEAERGEIKTVNGAAPDTNGNVQVSGLPEGAGAYQQLVTDSEGNARWEERLAYETEPEYITIIPELDATPGDISSGPEPPGFFLYGLEYEILPETTYVVRLGNKEYEVKSVLDSVIGIYVIGIPYGDAMEGLIEPDPSLPPFSIYADENRYYKAAFIYDESLVGTTFKFSVAMKETSTKKIDGQYLHQPDWSVRDPDDPAYVKNRTHYIRQGADQPMMDEVTVETTSSDGVVYAMGELHEDWFTPSGYELDKNAEPKPVFVVVWDGVRYERTVVYTSGSPSLPTLGSIEDGDPFYLSLPGVVFTPAAGTHTVQVFLPGEEEVVPLDPVYLPTTVPVLPATPTSEDAGKVPTVQADGTWALDAMPEGFSGSWDDLTGKPFYESPSTIGELLPETTIAPSRFTIGAALCFYADCQIDGIVAGNEYIVTVDSVDYTVIATSDERTLYLSYCEKNVKFEPAALFIEELGFAYGTTPYGTGFFGDDGLDAPHTYKVQGMVAGAIKPLDEQFIPSTVPVIPTASVGQTVVVKAVDENGKPTEWEAVDKFSGSYEDLTDKPNSLTNGSYAGSAYVTHFYPAHAVGIYKDGTYDFVATINEPGAGFFLGASAFKNQKKLVNAIVPANVANYGTDVFYGCTNLEHAPLPASLQYITSHAFYGCIGLKEVAFNGTPRTIANNVFEGCTNLTTINVPWAEGEVEGAPWGATNATINYNYTA